MEQKADSQPASTSSDSSVQYEVLQDAFRQAFPAWIDVPLDAAPFTTYLDWFCRLCSTQVLSAPPAFSRIDFPPQWMNVIVPVALFDQALRLERQSLCPPTSAASAPPAEPVLTTRADVVKTLSFDFVVPTTSTPVTTPAVKSVLLPNLLSSPAVASTTTPNLLQLAAEESGIRPDAFSADEESQDAVQTSESETMVVRLNASDEDMFDGEGSSVSSRSQAKTVASRSRSRSPLRPEPSTSRRGQLDRTSPPMLTRKQEIRRRRAEKKKARNLYDGPADVRETYQIYNVCGRPIILPLTKTGYRPYAEGHQAAEVDKEKSSGEQVYMEPTKYAPNLQRRQTLAKRQTGLYTRYMTCPRPDGPMGLLQDESTDIYKALGVYDDLDELQRSTPHTNIVKNWPERSEQHREIKLLLADLIDQPEVPLTYPVLNKNTARWGHQCFLPYTGDIKPNPIIDLWSQFGSVPAMAEHLYRVCPYRYLGCPWESSDVMRYDEHYFLSHVRFPLLRLCPCIQEDPQCFYLGSCVEDVENHIRGKATSQNPCPHHQKYYQRDPNARRQARRTYLPVRVYNRHAILATGWPRILDWNPNTSISFDDPSFIECWKLWKKAVRAARLLMVPKCWNTVRIRYSLDANDRSDVEKSISAALKPQETLDTLRYTKYTAQYNLDNWKPFQLKKFPVPLEPKRPRARTASTSTVTSIDSTSTTSDTEMSYCEEVATDEPYVPTSSVNSTPSVQYIPTPITSSGCDSPFPASTTTEAPSACESDSTVDFTTSPVKPQPSTSKPFLSPTDLSKLSQQIDQWEEIHKQSSECLQKAQADYQAQLAHNQTLMTQLSDKEDEITQLKTQLATAEAKLTNIKAFLNQQ